MQKAYCAAMLAAALTACGVHAQSQGTDHAAHHPPAAASPSQDAEFVQGEVRRVDHEANTVTLRYGPIPNLQTSDTTMVVQAQDPKMLRTLKVGYKVRFKAENVNGTLTVTAIEPAQ